MPESTTDRMLHPDEARAIVLAHATPLEPEVVPIADAGDHILADPLIADVSLPPFPAATMDGYAIVHDDPAPLREILGSGFAGDAATLTVAPGKAAKIMTGAPVPAGANAVVPVERTALVDGRVEIQQATVRDGENIRPVGADLREGDLLVPAGVRLGPAELGLLASLGHASVRVGRAPRVAVFSTGNELVDPGEEPGPGQIRDSNRFSLALAARRAGAEIVRTARLADEEAELRAALNAAIGEADVVLSSGGVLMGDKDLVKLLLGELAEVHFRRLFMKPGKPLTFATVPRDDGREVLLFGLPVTLSRDATDSLLDPTRGHRLGFTVTPYFGTVERDVAFLAATAGGSAYLALDDAARYVLAGRGRVGSIVGAKLFEVPANKRFYAGGGGSVRGYEFQTAGPLDEDDDPIGGRSLVELSAEMRIKVTENIGVVPFFDAGTVFESSFPDALDELFYAAGIGGRYYTGFGPIRLDVAFPLNKRERDDWFQFYVSIGQAF